jgi:hypothetical protein
VLVAPHGGRTTAAAVGRRSSMNDFHTAALAHDLAARPAERA